MKGWSVVLVAALFALAAKDTETYFVYLAYFPALTFWGLDGFFLRQERLFRKHYDHVRVLPEEQIDFSMNTSPVSDQVDGWDVVTLSKTLLAFHGVIVITIVIVMVLSIVL